MRDLWGRGQSALAEQQEEPRAQERGEWGGGWGGVGGRGVWIDQLPQTCHSYHSLGVREREKFTSLFTQSSGARGSRIELGALFFTCGRVQGDDLLFLSSFFFLELRDHDQDSQHVYVLDRSARVFVGFVDAICSLSSKRITPVTFRLKEGQSILLGGFACIKLVSGLPFFFTSIVAPTVTVSLCVRTSLVSCQSHRCQCSWHRSM